jgi:hypothetical protein
MSRVVLLLGAGVSVEAGMPTVKCLTAELRGALPNLRDAIGKIRPEFGEVFDSLARHDPEVSGNYERFFEWLRFIADAQRSHFRELTCIALPAKLRTAAAELPFVIGAAVKEVLASKGVKPDYLARLADFIPSKGRLKAFTLNYDYCVEEACGKAGITVMTGFDPYSGKWRPSLFFGRERGINLYKLHGSLCWFRNPKAVAGEGPRTLIEVGATGKTKRAVTATQGQQPLLILGPGDKLQADDPFLTLFFEFARAMARARACVVMGFGYRDEHVKKSLDQLAARGGRIIDVNPGNPCGRYMADNYVQLRMGAKQALLSGYLLREVKKLAL